MQKAYDRVLREDLLKDLEKKRVYTTYIRSIKGMYDGGEPLKAPVRGVDQMEDVPIVIGRWRPRKRKNHRGPLKRTQN